MSTEVETTEATKPKPQGKVRKRAPKACLSCRARKVRCDVSQRGRPCMNCYLDSETCVVTGRASRFRRQRENGDNVQASYPPYPPRNGAERHSAEAVVQSRLNGLPAPATATQQQHQQQQHSSTAETAQQSRTKTQSEATMSPRTDEANTALAAPHVEVEPRFAAKSADASGQEPPAEAYVQAPPAKPFSSVPDMSWATDQQQRQQQVHVPSSDVVYSYYPFLAISNLPNIPPQDVNFLESQGCLRVPTRALLDEFLQQYFLHVHPLLPLLNEGDFWDLYCLQPGSGGHGHGTISLLLFQSILFASCTFVSRSTVRALGHASLRAARATLYRRAKLLYDMESESSPQAIAQSALLLSYWAPSSTRKPNTAWLSLAIQHARSAEAHHYAAMPVFSASTHPLQRRKQNILKRLWWCCIVRDRTLGLLMRRPINITRQHFDFDANPMLGVGDMADELDRSRVYDADTKRGLAEVLAQLIELYVVLTDILMMVFPLDDTPGWGREMRPEDAAQVRECKSLLRRWYKDATLRFPMLGGGLDAHAQAPRAHDSVILYTNLMYMYYHSTRVVLCHHEVLHLAILQAAPGGAQPDLSRISENRHELQDAASGVTECLRELVHRRLARWLPISAVACTALPLVLNILDVKLASADGSTDGASKQHRLNVLIAAMKTYQPQYDGVDWISEIVRHIVNLSQLDSAQPDAAAADGRPKITDWTDILASSPSAYLRLALALDLSLSKGRLPEDGDFPVSLRGLFTGGFSPLKALIEANRAPGPPLFGDVAPSSLAMSFAGAGAGVAAPADVPVAAAPSGASFTHSHDESCSSHDSPSTHSDAQMSDSINPDDLLLNNRDHGISHPAASETAAAAATPALHVNGSGLDTVLGAGVDLRRGQAHNGGDHQSDDHSPSGSSDLGGMYIDGPVPDVSAQWIESLWDEMSAVEDKTDRDTARVLLEAMKDGDMGAMM